jgi:hypothetical protein
MDRMAPTHSLSRRLPSLHPPESCLDDRVKPERQEARTDGHEEYGSGQTAGEHVERGIE